MGALDRIVSAGEGPDAKGRGQGARGEQAVDALQKGAREPVEAGPTDDLASEQGGTVPVQETRRDAGPRQPHEEPPTKAREGSERAARADRGLGDGTLEPRARLPERRDVAAPPEAPARRDAKGAMARVANDALEPRPVATAPPPVRRGAEPTQLAHPGQIEVRREQVVRERVVERTLVDRLVIPERPVAATDRPASPLPSIIGPPGRKESTPKASAPAREAQREKEPTEPQASAPPRPRPAADDPSERERGRPRRQESPRQPPPRDAAREVVARVAPAARNAEVTSAGLRNERRERLDDAKDRTPRAAPGRAVANMVAPRPIKPPSAPTRAPAVTDAPRRDQPAPERPERPAPRPAPSPRIQISIGRVEVKTRPAEPTLQRGPATGPRSHQIDPGLGFGPLDGGRI